MRESLAKIVFCLAALCVGAVGCSKAAPPSQQSGPQPAKSVRLAPAQQLAVEETVPASGTLAAFDRAVLSAKVPGRIQGITVDLGSFVQKGDLLAQIEQRDFELRRQQAQAALAQARARLGLPDSGGEDQIEPENTSIVRETRALLAEATKNRDRISSLVQQGVLPDADAESAESQYQVALSRFDEAIHEARNRIATLSLRQAELALAEQELSDTEIRAPFDGVVEQRQTSPGEFLNVGSPVLTLVRVDPIRIRLEIAERDATRVKLGQKVYFRIEGSPAARQGTISRLSPVITRDNRMLLGEADVSNPDGELRPGSFATASVVVNANAPGIFVPRSAVLTFAGIQKIFLAQNGKAVETEIRLGRQNGDLVEVHGAVRAGELVVLEPGSLRNGEPVQPVVSMRSGT